MVVSGKNGLLTLFFFFSKLVVILHQVQERRICIFILLVRGHRHVLEFVRFEHVRDVERRPALDLGKSFFVEKWHLPKLEQIKGVC